MSTTKTEPSAVYVRRPAGKPLTDADAARLRALVPDDPIRLPANHLACEACGIAVPVPPEPSTEPLPLVVGDVVPAKPERFARCAECQRLHDQAAAYVEAHPMLARRIGPDIARERVESVLCGLAVLAAASPAPTVPRGAVPQPADADPRPVLAPPPGLT